MIAYKMVKDMFGGLVQDYGYPSVLTLNMLNCYKGCKIYIHILNHILDMVSPK